MCNPVAAVGLLVATTAVNYLGQDQMADRQVNAAQKEYEGLFNDLSQRSYEIDDTAAAEKSDIAIEALRKKGAMRVASSENLGMGITSQLLLQDVYAQEGREITAVETDRQRRQRQIDREKEGIKNRYSQRVSQVQRPSLLGSGLQIAGGTAGILSNNPSAPSRSVTMKTTPVGGGGTNWA